MKIKNLSIMASALALSTLLNGCTISISKKHSFEGTANIQVEEVDDIKDSVSVLANTNSVGFFFNENLTCPIEKIGETTYKWPKGYFAYHIDKNTSGIGIMGISNEEDYVIGDCGYYLDENGNQIPKNFDGYIGVLEEYKNILMTYDALENLVRNNDPKLTTKLEKVNSKDIIGTAYLLPTGYELYDLNGNGTAIPVEETKSGMIYVINDEEINNYVAVKPLIAKMLNNGKLLTSYLKSIYEEEKNILK